MHMQNLLRILRFLRHFNIFHALGWRHFLDFFFSCDVEEWKLSVPCLVFLIRLESKDNRVKVAVWTFYSLERRALERVVNYWHYLKRGLGCRYPQAPLYVSEEIRTRDILKVRGNYCDSKKKHEYLWKSWMLDCKMSWQQIFWKTSNGVLVRTDTLLDPSQDLQFCAGIGALSEELHLSYKELLHSLSGEQVENDITPNWNCWGTFGRQDAVTLTTMHCLTHTHTHTYPFLSVLKKRKDSWPGFQFIQLPGINGFTFFSPWGLAKRHFSGCQTLQWSQRLRQTECLYAWNTVAVYWNYDLQHKSFKICLSRPIWTCPAVNL